MSCLPSCCRCCCCREPEPEPEEQKTKWQIRKERREREAAEAAAKLQAKKKGAMSRIRMMKGLGMDGGAGTFLPFTDAHPSITFEEGGSVANLDVDNVDAVAVCEEPAMWGGVHRAKFTIVRSSGFSLGVGVMSVTRREGQDEQFAPQRGGWASREGAGWAWHCSGVLSHKGYHSWPAMQPYKAGDELILRLDVEAGTLSATHNGRQLGAFATNLAGAAEGNGGSGVGGSFCWMCELHNEDDAVRVEAVHGGDDDDDDDDGP